MSREPVAAGERGRLSISERAAERIALAVLTEVDGLTGPVHGHRGTARALPRVDAVVTGSVTDLDVRCAIAYPAPVASTVTRARAHLVERLHDLAGLTVAHADVTVVDLATDDRPARVLL